jgi:hypothetical protein
MSSLTDIIEQREGSVKACSHCLVVAGENRYAAVSNKISGSLGSFLPDEQYFLTARKEHMDTIEIITYDLDPLSLKGEIRVYTRRKKGHLERMKLLCCGVMSTCIRADRRPMLIFSLLSMRFVIDISGGISLLIIPTCGYTSL